MAWDSYKKATFWSFVAYVVLIAGEVKLYWDVKTLEQQSMAEPSFQIGMEKAIPPNPIFSQKANPFIVFRPSNDIYNKADEDKASGKENRITITNIGEALSSQTFVEMAVDTPFSIALVAVYAPEFGWLDSVDVTVRIPDDPNHQRVKLAISKVFAQNQRLEIYPVIVYAKSSREKYLDQDKIRDALKISVHSSTQKINTPSIKSFSVVF